MENQITEQNLVKAIVKHRIHREIGGLLDEKELPQVTILRDSACLHDGDDDREPEKKRRITLYREADPKRVRMCDVDILAYREGRGTVVIEIEESNLKPVQVFGKFFASAHSTHQGGRRLDDQRLLFIQVLVATSVDLAASGKPMQWKVLETIIKRNAAKDWPERDVQYELLGGGPDDFRPGSSKADRLVGLVRDFLGIKA
jgi:hypothetical protein